MYHLKSSKQKIYINLTLYTFTISRLFCDQMCTEAVLENKYESVGYLEDADLIGP